MARTPRSDRDYKQEYRDRKAREAQRRAEQTPAPPPAPADGDEDLDGGVEDEELAELLAARQSLLQAIRNDNPVEILKALRYDLAIAISKAEPHQIAPLIRQLRDVQHELSQIKPAEEGVLDRIARQLAAARIAAAQDR